MRFHVTVLSTFDYVERPIVGLYHMLVGDDNLILKSRKLKSMKKNGLKILTCERSFHLKIENISFV